MQKSDVHAASIQPSGCFEPEKAATDNDRLGARLGGE
jgi:hypothetical protein